MNAWLFSKRLDLWAFVGSFGLSMVALAIGAAAGVLDGDTPGWAWIPAILMVDVAHVWSTAYRTYFVPSELARRPWLYTMVPAFGFVIATLLYSRGELTFWRALAYLAIFHFVRQQHGWVMLYRARGKETQGRLLDSAAIYAATLWPLVYWHAHAPLRIDWFFTGDIVAIPKIVATITFPFYVAALGAYLVRAVSRYARGSGTIGKDIVVVTTAISWLVGIVIFGSDYAFTVTNVFMHGIPYFFLVFVTTRNGRAAGAPKKRTPVFASSIFAFIGIVWLIAYGEELIWDRAVWQERPWLFGAAWNLDALKWILVPLLALPQLTHYLLDAFLWKRRQNPDVRALVGSSSENIGEESELQRAS
ncbi:MAG: hypothetical protein ABI461_22925 [Polyangiaceae bacterium]